jgi:hypothetical protein
MDCTLYRDRTQPLPPPNSSYSLSFQLKTWFSRNLVWIVLIGLLLISLLVALLQ